MTAYGQSNPGQFAVKQAGQAFSIYPIQSMKADGSPNIITKTVLSNEISLSVAKAPLAAVVQQLCRSLTAASGKTVSVGTLPDDLAAAQSLSYTANAKAASTCLADITKQLGVNLSWQLLYDPRIGQYTLNAVKAEAGEDIRPQ